VDSESRIRGTNARCGVLLANLRQDEVYSGLELARDPKGALAVRLTRAGKPGEWTPVERVAWPEREATLGAGTLPVAHYVLTPRLGAFKRAIAKLLGKLPPDTHVWLTRDEAPAFLRFEGSLAIGLPAWRIESALPALGD